MADINVKTSGAVGDGTTDDRAAIQSAINAAIAAGENVYFPPGTYKISKYLDVNATRGLRLYGNAAATVLFPSDDTTIAPDAVVNLMANPNQAARSALLIRNSQSITVEGLGFQGGTKQQIYDVNLGCAIYAHRCIALTMSKCVVRDGNAPLLHEQNADVTGTGDSLTNASGVVTLVDAGAAFNAGMVGLEITIANATNVLNNGRFYITQYVSATSVKFANVQAVTETSSFAWSVGNSDRGAFVTDGRFYNCRSTLVPCKGTRIVNCNFHRPMTQDFTGRITSFAKSGTSITIACPRGSFSPSVIGKRIVISGSTSNDGGPYVITAVTPKTGVAPASLTYTRAAGGAPELATTTTRFFIPNGERVGIGAGLSKSVSTMTLTAASGSFSSADVGKAIRITGATSAANNIAAVILTATSTQVTFTNASGATDGAYTGAWSVDSYDNVRDSGINYGSTHAIYMFAGRSDVSIIGCGFYGIRGAGVKLSGSTAPIEGVIVQDCVFQECASAILFGADDSQEHTSLKFEGNRLLDCANGRPGWTEQCAFYGLGSRTVSVKNNTIHYTHDEIATVDGRGTAGGYAVYIGRYRAGLSQPVENVDIQNNQITADPLNCTAAFAAIVAVHVDSCGLLARYRKADTGVTLTFDAAGTTLDPTGALGTNVVELYDPSAYFCQEIADGWTISIVDGSDADNRVIEAPIRKVVGTQRLYYTNNTAGASTVSNANVGTYRLKPPVGKRGSTCRIAGNEIAHVGAIAIQSLSNVGPEITGNIVHGVGALVEESGSTTPRIAHNRLVGKTTLSAGIRLNSGTTWPIVHDNTITGNGDHLAVTKATYGEIGIGVDSSTHVDYPLLGKCGKAKPTEGKAEAVFGYGPASDFVDGDTIGINGVTYTYKATGPTGNQFNSLSGLLALVAATGGGTTYTATDYGAQFAAAVTTSHGRIRLAAANTSGAGVYIDSINTCNPTVLVVPRNTAGSEAYLQGLGPAAPLVTDGTRTVVWSPLIDYSCQVVLTANNSQAATLLQAGGYYPEKAANNAGACEVLRHNDCAGSEEFRWSIPS